MRTGTRRRSAMQTQSTIFTMTMPLVTIPSRASESSGEVICRRRGVIALHLERQSLFLSCCRTFSQADRRFTFWMGQTRPYRRRPSKVPSRDEREGRENQQASDEAGRRQKARAVCGFGGRAFQRFWINLKRPDNRGD